MVTEGLEERIELALRLGFPNSGEDRETDFLHVLKIRIAKLQGVEVSEIPPEVSLTLKDNLDIMAHECGVYQNWLVNGENDPLPRRPENVPGFDALHCFLVPDDHLAPHVNKGDYIYWEESPPEPEADAKTKPELDHNALYIIIYAGQYRVARFFQGKTSCHFSIGDGFLSVEYDSDMVQGRCLYHVIPTFPDLGEEEEEGACKEE